MDTSTSFEDAFFTLELEEGFFSHSFFKEGEEVDYGAQIALSGNSFIISESSAKVENAIGGQNDVGRVYLYSRSSGISPWSREMLFEDSMPECGEKFGQSISFDSNIIAVGVPLDDDENKGLQTSPQTGACQSGLEGCSHATTEMNCIVDSGAVHVMEKNSEGVWFNSSYIKPTISNEGYQFGFSTAVNNDTLVVSAYGDDLSGCSSVSRDVNVFNNDSIDLNICNTEEADTLSSRENSGSVYIYKRSQDNSWILDAFAKPSNITGSLGFGVRVDLEGEHIAVAAIKSILDSDPIITLEGRPLKDASSVYVDSGVIYLFQKESIGEPIRDVDGNMISIDFFWTQSAYIRGVNTKEGDYFGCSDPNTRNQCIFVNEDTLVVGAPGEDGQGNGVSNQNGHDPLNSGRNNSGAVYVFRKINNDFWVQDAYIKAPDPDQGDQFGWSLDASSSGNTIAVGAPFADGKDNAKEDQGAVYIFKKTNEGEWYFAFMLDDTPIRGGSQFGYSISMQSNNEVVVSAMADKSNFQSIKNGLGASGYENASDVDSSDTVSPAIYFYQTSFLIVEPSGQRNIYNRETKTFVVQE